MCRWVALLFLVVGCGLPPDAICDDANNPCRGGLACVQGVCQQAVAPVSTCTDGARNGAESDVDCGGTCTPCGATLGCNTGADCASTLCVNNRCACPAGQRVQGVACVNNSDAACGPSQTNCATAFPGGAGVCNSAAGTCVLTSCNAGAHLCNGACASDASPQTCGTSCTACAPPPSGGAAACNAGACGISCDPGFHANGAACDADTPTACGSATKNCTTSFPNGTGTCTPSTASAPAACVLTGCSTGFNQVGSTCVSQNVTSCGGVNCTDGAHQDPHGTMTCASGQCQVANCNQGFHPNSSSLACDVSSDTCCGPGPGCKDCTSSFANGSGICAVNAATPKGACAVSTCGSGFHPDAATNRCDANTDTACGTPPVDCTQIAHSSSTCNAAAGSCAVTCSSGYHAFNGGCEQNTDTVCGAGRINCTTQFANGTGSCNAAAGTCALAGCLGGYHNCGGACVSDTSVNTCGSSCSPCPTDPRGTTTCDGTSCRRPRSSRVGSRSPNSRWCPRCTSPNTTSRRRWSCPSGRWGTGRSCRRSCSRWCWRRRPRRSCGTRPGSRPARRCRRRRCSCRFRSRTAWCS